MDKSKKEDKTQEQVKDFRRWVDEVIPQQEREIKENNEKSKG